MSVLRHLPILVFVLALAAGGRAGAAVRDDDPVLGDAIAVLAMNDLEWIERQVVQFASSSGVAPKPIRDCLAQILFRSRSLDGIDLSRPALVAWRPGAAPFVAIIPLSNRRLFMANFGAVQGMGAPLIRVGERDGTTVYTQNTADGLCEYRLLAQDDFAFVARSDKDCRRLAEHPLRLTGSEPPLSFRASGAFFAGIGDRHGDLIAGDGDVGLSAARLAFAEWHDLLDQVGSVACDVLPDPDGVRVQARLLPAGDSSLAQWIAAQKNQGSRLLPALRSPETVLALYGAISWQGQLDRLGQRLIGAERKRFGDTWTPVLEDAWRQQWSLLDHQGPFAQVVEPNGRAIGTRLLIEQPRAGELVAALRTIEPVYAPAATFSDAAGGSAGYRCEAAGRDAGGGPIAVTRATLGDDQMVAVVTRQGDLGDDPVSVAAQLLTAAKADTVPEGDPGLIGFDLDLCRLVTVMAAAANIDAVKLPALRLGCAVKATPQGNVTLDVVLPLPAFALLLRDSNLLATDTKVDTPKGRPHH